MAKKVVATLKTGTDYSQYKRELGKIILKNILKNVWEINLLK